MRIHVQNPPSANTQAITPDKWAQALARAGLPADQHGVSFGATPEEFAAAMADAEAAVMAASDTKALFPADAPALRLLFCTSAGLDSVPFASLPPGVRITHTSLFDGSNEGIACDAKRAFSVQYHPEASPGPTDSQHLFRRFVAMMNAEL